MDFILRYGPLIWIAIAVVCTALGTYFTIAKSHKHGRPPIQTPHILEHRPQHCLACGCLADDPEACFCWFCGSLLDSTTTQSQRQKHTETILIDERVLEQELRRKKQAR